MIEMQIPQDIKSHESKIVGRFTARQIAFVCAAAFVGFLTWRGLSASGAEISRNVQICIVGLVAVIPLAFGFIKIQDQPLEKMGMVVLKENIFTPGYRVKEYRHPELEKWEKDPMKVAGIVPEEENAKKSGSKKSSKKDEFHVKRSKNFKGIR